MYSGVALYSGSGGTASQRSIALKGYFKEVEQRYTVQGLTYSTTT
jgi:hypothetical protein